MQEAELYPPIKAFLEAQGYEVKSEVRDCDVVAQRGDEEPVIIELKTGLTIALLLQGVNRQALSDQVYLAIPARKSRQQRAVLRDAVKLCRRLGLGLLTVGARGAVNVMAEPGPYQPRQNQRKRKGLLREFNLRQGDPNTGGQTRQIVVTAYRQEALRIARLMQGQGQVRPAQANRVLGIDRAQSILAANYYGWFTRIERGVYGLTDAGETGLAAYADILSGLPGVVETAP